MSEHTKEPWHTGADNKLDLIIYDKDGWAISNAITYHGHHLVDEAKSNARLIVACVNACAGVPNDSFDGGWTALGMSQYAKKIEVQRDDLLINLKKLVDINCPMTGNPSYQELIEFWEFEEKEGRGIAKDMISAIKAIINCEYKS